MARRLLSLRPPKGIVKYLLVSPSGFVGEAEHGKHFLLTHAFPITNQIEQFSHAVMSTPPFTRGFYVLGFQIQPEGALLGNEGLAERILAAVSVYLGKRIDNLGIVELDGSHALPLTQDRIAPKLYRAGFWHSKPRANCGFGFDRPSQPLNLGACTPLLRKVLKSRPERPWRHFHGAASFYLSALRLCSVDLEKAYLDLVMSLEVLAGYYRFSDLDLYGHDDQLLKALKAMKAARLNSQAALVKRRLFQVKRKVLLTAHKLMTKEFFERHEAFDLQFALKEASFGKYIAAAYDLRSKYVHSGFKIQHFLTGVTQQNAEINVGTIDGDNRKLYGSCPTFVGLERMTRFMLLRFVAKYADLTHPDLAGTEIAMAR